MEGLRPYFVGLVSPLTSLAAGVKDKAVCAFSLSSFTKEEIYLLLQELEDARRENKALSEQLENVKQWLLHEDRIAEQMTRLKELDAKQGKEEFFARRRAHLVRLLELQMQGLPARVVYREPCAWSSFLWISLGHKDNQALGKTIVAKNSPVVIGNVLVGIVEEVQDSLSKVRLITDDRLTPAVRAVRGDEQQAVLLGQIDRLSQLLEGRRELFASDQEERAFFAFLKRFSSQSPLQSHAYLAKGELYGSSSPLWRARGQTLKGVGFNYAFGDEEGGPKDIRTADLLKQGDLLITSGLDGLFPPGLEVAIVTKVECLREGESSFQIEAVSLLEDMQNLHSVFVLPAG